MSRYTLTKLSALTIGLFTISFGAAKAGFVSDLVTSPLTSLLGFIVGTVNYLIGVIGSIFVQIGAYLIDWGIAINTNIVNDSFVARGFGVTLDIVNLGFVLAIILISFATILRLESYDMKKMLWKLIVAALLVNFSLTIAGVFLDFTGVFSQFFIDRVGGATGFSTALTNAFQPQNLLETSGKGLEAIGNDLNNMASIIASLFFTVFFTIIVAIVMIGTAVMIFLRYIHVTILLILMPFAWLFWVLPFYSHLAGKWWDNFLRWTFFMPAALFFIYLAMMLASAPPGQTALTEATRTAEATLAAEKEAAKTSDIVKKADVTGRLLESQGAPGDTIKKDFFTNIGKMMAVIGILVGGLMAANSLGIEGAGAAMALAGKTKGWVTGATGKIAKGTLSPGTNRMLSKGGLIDKASTVAAKLSTSPLRFIPGVSAGARAAAAGLSKLTSSRQQAVENYQKNNLGNLNNDALKAVTAKTSWDPVTNAAMASELAKRNMTDPNNIDQTRLTSMLVHAKNMGVGKQILENRADLAPQLIDKKPDQTDLDVIRATISKLSPQAMIKQSAEALKNDDVIRSLKDNQLAEMIKSGSGEQMEALKFGIERLKAKEPEHQVVQVFESSIGAKRSKKGSEEGKAPTKSK